MCKAHQGYPKALFWDPSFSPHSLHHWDSFHRTWFLIQFLCFSFQPHNLKIAAQISDCQADISAWVKEHHLQLNLAKEERYSSSLST